MKARILIITVAVVGTANAAFTAYFDDSFEGNANSAFSTTTLASIATTANSSVSDYNVTSSDGVRIFDLTTNSGAPPTERVTLDFFGGANTTASIYLNLTTVTSATYRIQLQTAMWGNDFESDKSYTLNASVFNGADTTGGTALNSDSISMAANSNVGTISTFDFTFIAQSTATTFFIDGSIGNTNQHNVWIDNIDIDEDLSTVPEPRVAAMLGACGLLLLLRRRRCD